MEQKFISYDGLPLKSGGSHRLNNIPGTLAYHQLTEFARTFTDKPLPFCTIQLNASDKSNGPKASVWFMIKTFGLPVWSLNYYLATREFTLKFRVGKNKIERAVNLRDEFVNVTFSATWLFKFIDPETGQVLPGQDNIPVVDIRLHNSQVYMRLGKGATVSLWFTLPFSGLTDDAVRYIKLLKNNLPVKLSYNHWRVWKLSNGRLIPRKLDISAIDEEL